MTAAGRLLAPVPLLVPVLLLAVACSRPATTACPAIGWGSALVVQLDDWPAGAVRLVEVDCDVPCGVPVFRRESSGAAALPVDPGDDAGLAGPLSAEVDAAGRAAFSLVTGRPAEVTVRILEGAVVEAELTVEPEFVRVGGTEACGGPTEATVVVTP